MLHIWVVVLSARSWAFSALIILISGCLQGCYKWEASNHPVCGVSVTYPQGTLLSGSVKFLFKGSVIANFPDSLFYGVVYAANGYEAYQYPTYTGFDTLLSKQLDSKTTLFKDSILLPGNALPGRYKAFSVLKDTRNVFSDTLEANQVLIDTLNFPTILPVQNLAFSEAATLVTAGKVLIIPFIAQDKIAIDTLSVSFCQVLDTGNISCKLISKKQVTTKRILDTAQVEFPVNAVSTQRYRVHIKVKNTNGYSYIWKPLYLIQ